MTIQETRAADQDGIPVTATTPGRFFITAPPEHPRLVSAISALLDAMQRSHAAGAQQSDPSGAPGHPAAELES